MRGLLANIESFYFLFISFFFIYIYRNEKVILHTTLKNQLSRLPTTNPSLAAVKNLKYEFARENREHFLAERRMPIRLTLQWVGTWQLHAIRIHGNSHYYWSSFLFPADCQQWKYQVIPTTNVHLTFAINYLHLPQFSSLSSDPSLQSGFESHRFLASTHLPLSQMYSSSLHFADKRRRMLTWRTRQYKGHCQPAFH